GTWLVGHAPHIAPEAWLHVVFPGLVEDDLNKLVVRLGKPIPDEYELFLRLANGLDLYSSSISFSGLRRNYARNSLDVWQPFDILTPNLLERPADSRESHFFIGGYKYDGSQLYIDSISGQTHRCLRKSVRPLNTWRSFRDMLLAEAMRVASLFDVQ